ncbi:Rpn family recombination-promoting nuclease/putative transposase [Petrotoga sp. 9PWA.NaAc.5.4]|uniref:Rpn family recombination-promoting nuclease/putative transposase n=1 Tax=Petrotoga sp. 9PWA.NaAc.5.4 TaxID=1434328 RepID=UPI000CC9668E|nr:Rpn family recombination-promoting nuclease/putative transposase [Petrotoga sp. 9PWA.NaAc.5.4]PNR92991.1 hypothetical protein X924_08395 [Petrotoga sp. 9PWA.NaAc.5.4]
MVKTIDLNTLEKENGSYVDENLQESFKDMLYKTTINGVEGYIYILFEHKSYNDSLVSFQILKYIIKIWEEKIDKKQQKLPLIIPILIYNAEKEWKVETNLINLIENIDQLPKEMKRYIPNYEYEVYDFSPKAKTTIMGLTITKVVLETIKVAKIPSKKEFLEGLKKMFEYIVQLPEVKFNELFEICMMYLLNTKDDIDIGEIRQTAKEILSGRSEVIMSIAEKLRQEGKLEGKLEERKEFTIKLLSKKFGVNLTEELKEKIRNADEKTINYIGDNLLEITIEELKEILK